MKRVLFHIALLILVQACVTKPDEIRLEPNAEDIAVINEIGQSLGVQSDGVVSSIYDATATLSQNGMSTNDIIPKSPGDNFGRGNDSNVQVSVNFLTGVHNITFDRTLNSNGITKNLAANLNYIYKNDEGNFVFFPRRQPGEIASIQFYGFKMGQMIRPNGRSGFTRTDSLLFDGMGRNSGGISVRGVQRSRGFIEFNHPEETVFRFYAASYRLNDIEIRRQSVEQRDLSKALRGSMDYHFISKQVVNSDTVSHTYSGTIEFSGEGTAIVRSRSFRNPFLIDLKNGQVIDHKGGRNGRP